MAEGVSRRVYIDNKVTNAAEALQKLGGAQVILATAPSSKSMTDVIDGLAPNGKLLVVGASMDPIEVTPIQLIQEAELSKDGLAEHQPIPRTHCASPN